MKQNNEKINELIKRIKKGDKKAFEELYNLTSGQAYFLVLKIVQNEQDAEDILQESYVKLLERIDEIDPSQSFTAWFYKIAINKSKDLLRRKNRVFFETAGDETFDEIAEENTEFCPEETIDLDELTSQVMAAIDELTEEKRTCIIMKYYAQMSVNEIAGILHVPVSTVKNRLFSARKDLKVRFEKLGKAALYSAAPIGIIVWALNRSSLSVCAAFSASATSASILASVGNFAAGTSAAAATGSGIAAKVAAMSVAQKIAAGAVAATLVGGTTAGTATLIKHKVEQNHTTAIYDEQITTSATMPDKVVYAETSFEEDSSTAENESVPFASTMPILTSNATTTEKATENPTTSTTAEHTTKPSTTQVQTTAQTTVHTTLAPTTSAVTTEHPTEATTYSNILIEVTTAPTTVAQTTAVPATLIIDITDYDDNVVNTLTLNIEPGTKLTWDYLIELVSKNGYEAMAGIYGNGVDTVAAEGKTYTFTAEL